MLGRGKLVFVTARQGAAGAERYVLARCGEVMYGAFSQGVAGMARQGRVSQGEACQGGAWHVWIITNN